jgi:hypothetical protein
MTLAEEVVGKTKRKNSENQTGILLMPIDKIYEFAQIRYFSR